MKNSDPGKVRWGSGGVCLLMLRAAVSSSVVCNVGCSCCSLAAFWQSLLSIHSAACAVINMHGVKWQGFSISSSGHAMLCVCSTVHCEIRSVSSLANAALSFLFPLQHGSSGTCSPSLLCFSDSPEGPQGGQAGVQPSGAVPDALWLGCQVSGLGLCFFWVGSCCCQWSGTASGWCGWMGWGPSCWSQWGCVEATEGRIWPWLLRQNVDWPEILSLELETKY